jgi:hypothetical protein
VPQAITLNTLPRRQSRSRRGLSRSRRGWRDCQGGVWRHRLAERQLEPVTQPVDEQGTHYDVRKLKIDMEPRKTVSVSLPTHLASGVRRCSAVALRFFRGEPCVLWATTFKFFRQQQRDFTAGISSPMFIGWGRGHPLPPCLLPFECFVLADAEIIHLNFKKAKPINSRISTRSRVATSYRCFCISAKRSV